jgi:hypothetical protein
MQTFFIRNKVYTNFLFTGQSLYRKKFILDKVYTGTKFIQGQSSYRDKVYMGHLHFIQKIFTFIQILIILYDLPKKPFAFCVFCGPRYSSDNLSSFDTPARYVFFTPTVSVTQCDSEYLNSVLVFPF